MSSVEANANARGTLVSVSDEKLVLSIPGTEYRLDLVPTVPAASIGVAPGKRIRGVINASALRIHAAAGGGRFIEPVYGAPRIVAGVILQVDEERQRALVDVTVPMWVHWDPGQDTSVLQVDQLVNFYVRSGTSFTPGEA
jgi:hypothetical protein